MHSDPYFRAGNATFNAREGEHDDLVLALAIAVFGLSESECATPAEVAFLRQRLLGT